MYISNYIYYNIYIAYKIIIDKCFDGNKNWCLQPENIILDLTWL